GVPGPGEGGQGAGWGVAGGESSEWIVGGGKVTGDGEDLG
ncbi:hypothetical protein TIFTF001_048737, partial [Ficus carica]